MKVVVATDNPGKLREFRRLLAPLNWTVLGKKEAGCLDEIPETGSTFAENAFIKASAVARLTGLPALADDSGLCVDALDGAPGLYSARFTGSHADSDERRNEYLLEKLQGAADRSAHYVCSLSLVFPDGTHLQTEENCCGEILETPAGCGGFGYDPLFRPDGFNCSMAELTDSEKDDISHRGKAIRALARIWEDTHND